MALKPTIYKLSISISDLNREIYESANLTVALHPSETLERMMARIVAYCLNAQDNISFARGLSVVEEPDVWVKTLDDRISLWLEVGEPSIDRVKKSSRLATEVRMYSFNSKSETWWAQSRDAMGKFDNVQFYQFDWGQIRSLAALAKRTMDWSVTISGDTVYVADGEQQCDLVLRALA